jgi:biotin operon repressor
MQSFELPDEPIIKQHRPQDLRKYSIVPIRAAADRRIRPAAMRVLLTVCSYANRAGLCWPSHANVGKALGVSRQAAGRQIRILRELGYFKVVKNHSYGKTAQIIRVVYDETLSNSNLMDAIKFEDLPPTLQAWKEKETIELLNQGKEAFNNVAVTASRKDEGELVTKAYIARWISLNRQAGFSRLATPEDEVVIAELAAAGVTVPVLDDIVRAVLASVAGTSREPPHRISAFRRQAIDAVSKEGHVPPLP